jgi:hypothetical protein
MRIRIEFGPSKSTSYPWAVRLAKKYPTHRETVEEGITIHTVEFSDIESFVSFQNCVGGWRNVAYYLDDQPAHCEQLWDIFYKKYPPSGSLQPIETQDGKDGPYYYLPARSVVETEIIPPKKKR